ncbi:TPA: ATP-dependent DNA helicase [Clostridioides difficile]|nr:ATP-dependent DNA helicase [Clostridioides difficile]HBE9357022.1 ATP-dependent DNA helicase [Clostridioides difficile]
MISIFRDDYKASNSILNYYSEQITSKVWNFFMDEIPARGYESREGQEDMALDICDAIKSREHIIIEAGVGIGKSYAYLVPLIYYNNLTGHPVIISTSSILLQEQLTNDIKSISEMLYLYPEVIFAKGMTHFKCPKRASQYLDTKGNSDIWLREWIEDETVGDRKQLPGMVKDSIWNQINVKKCEFKNCEMYNNCYYTKLRDKMKYTNGIILCNHDLLAIDLQNKSNYRREILSRECKLIVVDEAHNLEEKVRNSLKETYTYGEALSYIKDAIKYINKFQVEYDYEDKVYSLIKNIYTGIMNQVKEQDLKVEKGSDIERYYLTTDNIDFFINEAINMISSLNIKVQLIDSEKNSDTQDNIIENLDKMLSLFKNLKNKNSNYIFWVELINSRKNMDSIKIINCPKRMEEEIKNLFFASCDFRTILTSATLTNSELGEDEERYKYIASTIGYPINNGGILSTPKESPYDYDNNALVYYRNDMPHPTKDRTKYIEKSIDVIEELISITEGRTMVLFTAKSDMMDVYEKLKNRKIGYKVIVQQEGMTQDSIIAEFKKDEGTVLLGTGSYWEGLSIEGRTLSSLIIFRLPFPVPDPIIDFKSSLSENPLMEVQVPEMIIKLKQGVGRLIRTATDKGIVTILDSRIDDNSLSPYKKVVWDSIPIKVKTNDINRVRLFAQEKILDK